MDAETRLGAAVLIVQRQHPYLSAALWAVRRVVADGLGTMAVDAGWRLFYDPAALNAWEVEELAGVVYHELCHLIRDHAGRASAIDRKDIWNMAADAEINDDIRTEDVALPDGTIFPWSFGQPPGKLAEEYYAALLGSRSEAEASGPAAGQCGGAATGEGMDGAEALGTNNWRVPPSIGAGEQEVIRRRVALEIDQHCRQAGSVPGHLARWAEARLEPRVDWRRELAALVRWGLAEVAGLVDYSYARPSRRQASAGRVVLPSLRRPVPRIAVVVDTSGSMTDEMLAVALAEIRGILAAAGARDGLDVLSVDADVQQRQRVTSASSTQLRGGGGTDMGVGLAAAARLSPRPEILVVVTDGFTPWPERPLRGIKTIVVQTDAAGSSPAWARTVVMPPDAA